MSVLLKFLSGLTSLAMLGALTVTDPTGDAVGDGTIVAPTASRYANSAIFDLQDVSIEVLQQTPGGSIILLPDEPEEAGAGAGDGEGGEVPADQPPTPAESPVEPAAVLSVLTVTLGAIDVSESTALGFGSVVIDLYLDGAQGGRETTLDGPGMLMPAGRGWEYAVRLTPDGATGYRYVEQPHATVTAGPEGEPAAAEGSRDLGADAEPEALSAPPEDLQRVPVGVSLQGSMLTIALPWGFPDEVVAYALSGVHDPFNPTGWRPLADAPSPWAYSGGEQVVPVIDLVAPDQATQERALRTGVLPLPAVAVRDAGTLWLLLMALGVLVAAAGLMLRRRVAAPAAGPGRQPVTRSALRPAGERLRTGLPPAPVSEARSPTPERASSEPLAATDASTDEPVVRERPRVVVTDDPAAEGAETADSATTSVGSEGPTAATVAPEALPTDRTHRSDQPPQHHQALQAHKAEPTDAEPASSSISAFDSYVLSEALAETEEQDVEGFDDLT